MEINKDKREEATNWYADSASGVAESLSEKEKRDESTNWYSDSASGVAESLSDKEKRSENTDWYTDSASGVAESLSKKDKRDDSTNWYADSASGVVESLSNGKDKRDDSTNWYSDSASGVAESLSEKDKRDESTNWYADSASGVVESLSTGKNKRDDSTNWYSDSASGVAGSLESKEKREESTNWYSDSASGMAESLAKRFGLSNTEKQSYEEALRDWIYYDMRKKTLRESSDRGKAFFEFTPKPRDDLVDRWHVPVELQERFNAASTSDAERVSILNYYLMVTGRDLKSAEELGFTPTADQPGITETNEVGYGYMLAGQHQHHCVEFVADAVDIGKKNLNDFYLKHTIHCLGLLKYLAPKLTMKQPNSFLVSAANERLLNGFPQTVDEL